MRRKHIGIALLVVALVTVAGFAFLGGNGDGGPAEREAFTSMEADDSADAAPVDDTDDAVPADDSVDEAAAEEPMEADDAESEDVATSTTGENRDVDQQEFVANRQLIHTGTIGILVDDVPATSTEVREWTADQGGFVSSSTQEVHEAHNETWTTETLVIRVPSETFDTSMQTVETLGEVQTFETETEDVTDQLVDLDARLENLRMERDRLRTLFEEANETRDVLAVQDELASVQEEIERLEAQRQQLEDQVAFSTITVHLTEEEPEAEPTPEEPEWYETSVAGAFFDSVDGLIVAARALVVGVAFAVPYLLVLAAGTVLVGGLYRYRSGSTADQQHQDSTTEEQSKGSTTEGQSPDSTDEDNQTSTTDEDNQTSSTDEEN